MFSRFFRTAMVLVGGLLAGGESFAEIAPRDPAQLNEQSQAIVTGKVVNIQTQTQRSEIEKGFGSYDWAITVSLEVQACEKGDIPVGETLQVQCWRMKCRKSMVESFSPSGHDPIPPVGDVCQVYLARDGDGWEVVLPNGFVGLASRPMGNVSRAVAPHHGFTYFLPVGAWIVLGVFAAFLAAVIRLVRWASKRARKSAAAAVKPVKAAV